MTGVLTLAAIRAQTQLADSPVTKP